MIVVLVEVLARCVPFAVGWFLIGAALAWRTRPGRASLRAPTGSPYRAPFDATDSVSAADPGDPRQAGVETERRRVLVIVEAVRAASGNDLGRTAAEAIRGGIEGAVSK